MDGHWGHYAKQNKLATKRQTLWSHLYLLRAGDKVEWWVSEVGGVGRIGTHYCRVSVLEDEVLWRWTVTMAAQQWMYLMPLNCTLKN